MNMTTSDALTCEAINDNIDWTNPGSKISKYFTVGEAIYLREWKRLATEADGLTLDRKVAIVFFALTVADPVREFLDVPCITKSWFRPDQYNVEIGGAPLSSHRILAPLKGVCAWDFWTDIDGNGTRDGYDCDAIKAKLMPALKRLGIRMEDNGKGAKWVHIDNNIYPLGRALFFKP